MSDRERALKFYARLGFQFEEPSPESPPQSVEIINENGVRINLICSPGAGPRGRGEITGGGGGTPGVTHIAFVVRSVDEALAFVRRHGIRVAAGPKKASRRRYFFFRDPDGNLIELNEYRRPGAR